MNQPYSKRTVFSWSLYDFANQPFTTLVVTFIYGTFFTQVIAENEIVGTMLWSRGITITGLAVAILSPIMGAVADRGGYRKLFLIFWTIICILGSFLLYFPQPGQVVFALTVFIIANIGFEMGGVFCNAFLPDIAPKEKIGRVSGYGWSFGYVGGLIALVIGLLLFIQPDVPIFNLNKETYEHIRATNILVAIWFAVFCLPTFIFVRQTAKNSSDKGYVIKDSMAQLKDTFKNVRQYKDMTRFLIARLIYNDGLITVFAFGGIYAAGTFGFTFQEIMIFGIVLNVTAGLGAFLMGFLDDVIGGKKTIQLSNMGLIVACIIAVFAPSRDLFYITIPLLGSHLITGKTLFWLAGILIGIFSGPNQSASRSLMARFVPREKENEFFGFFAFSGKATAFAGPFLLGYLTQTFGSQRFGVGVVIIFLIIGSILLRSVDEKAGMAAADK
ncbi:MAG: MFS transporter [Candidatus Marinimicrobia bacterium]|nr:MFS transporter [Candidatus Neomarinimicrobiota bacterium]